ncbi:MAG: hypothetical protein JWM80_2184 [Cyanobacteria bacterium RYN_339]|nr:hypothetical protein [Cyanobacteria bacterium RYN_339]
MRALLIVLLVLSTGCRLAPAKPGVGTRASQVAIWRLPGTSSLYLEPASLPAFTSVVLTGVAPSVMDVPMAVTLDAAEVVRAGQAREAELRYLPARPDLEIDAFFRGPDERLVAIVHQQALLAKGVNALPLSWQELPAPQAVSGGPGVSVADGVVIKGEAVRLTTGLPDGAPGLGRVDVFLDGPAYAGGTAQIGSFRAPRLAAYTWSPGVAVGTYDPELLGGPGRQAFTLTARAYDRFGSAVGKTVLPLQIEGAAAVSIGIHH